MSVPVLFQQLISPRLDDTFREPATLYFLFRSLVSFYPSDMRSCLISLAAVFLIKKPFARGHSETSHPLSSSSGDFFFFFSLKTF